MQALARQMVLLPDDWVWQEGQERKDGSLAESEFDFSKIAAAAPKTVVEPASRTTKVDTEAHVKLISEPPPSSVSPEWIEDLRLWIDLDADTPPAKYGIDPADILPKAPSQETGIPDWLADWRVPEPAPAPSAAPPEPAPPPPPVVPVKPTAAAAPLRAVPVKPAPEPPPHAVPVKSAAEAPAPAPAAPVSRPLTPPAAPSAVELLGKRMREENGFDPDTGQIIDPVKFRRWQQKKAPIPMAGQPAVSSAAVSGAGVINAGVIDAFRKGRIAIDAWLDDDKNRLKVMHGDLAEIRRQPAIGQILDECANFGKEIQDKLLRHLEFMLENRKKYLKATEGRSS
jgi:hypothetical protein